MRWIVKKAYEAGAEDVVVDWRDDVVDRMRFEMANEEVFKNFSYWYAKEKEELAEKGAAFIYIDSSTADLLEGIPTERICWTMIASLSADWAAKVFPDAPKEKQVELLWEVIFVWMGASNINQEGIDIKYSS